MRETKFFGSPAFRRLWFSQLFSSTGDWVGIFATTVIAGSIAGPGGMSLVLAIRMGLAFFTASFVGVLVDRANRKHIMVLTLVVRALIFSALPFVDTLLGLVLASLALEIMTLMYSAAKEASVPNLVSKSFLPTATSLSLTAAYGSALPAALLLALLAQIPELITGQPIAPEDRRLESTVALFANAFMYLVAAALIATLALGKAQRVARAPDVSRAKAGFKEAVEGIRFVVNTRRVRGVVFGLAAGLIGGGSVVPLGVPFSTDILNGGSSGFGVLLVALGSGVAIGVVTLTAFFNKVHPERLFVMAIVGAGVSLGVAASMNGFVAAAFCIVILGLCAGAVYVIGFATLQTNVDDQLRGRVFATFYTLTRVGILSAIVVAPIVSLGLDEVSNRFFDGSVQIGALHLELPGVRLTLWLSSLIILAAGFFVFHTFRKDGAFNKTVDA